MFYKDPDIFWYRATWRKKLSILPRRCATSKELLWFKKAYLGQTTYFGPGDPVVEERWLSDKEYIFKKLKGEIL
jgi:hypothetical protein